MLIQDAIAHAFATIPGIVFSFTLRQTLPKLYIIAWLSISLIYAPFNFYLSVYQRQYYLYSRLANLVIIRAVTPAAFIGFAFYDKLPAPTFGSIIMSIFTKSAAGQMMFCSLNFRVSFLQHLIYQTMAYIFSLLYVPGFCQRCSSELDIQNKFQEMGQVIDRSASFLLFNSSHNPSTSYPCWMITTMIITIVGFVLPTFVVFVAEVSSRYTFLKAKIDKQYQTDLRKYKDSAMRVGIAGFAAAIIGIWLVLAVIRDLVLNT